MSGFSGPHSAWALGPADRSAHPGPQGPHGRGPQPSPGMRWESLPAQEILEMYASKLILDEHVDLRTLARRTAGMTGASLPWDFVVALKTGH